MESKQIPKERIEELVNLLMKNPNVVTGEPTNKYEMFRGRLGDSLIVVYSSGKITFHENSEIEAILQRFPSGKSKKSKVKGRELNVKMNDTQRDALIERISVIAEEVEVKGESEIASFLIDGSRITIWETGTVYSATGHPKYEEMVFDVISDYPTHPEYDIIIGQDEVGKGELFGPMIVGSVALTQAQSIRLQFDGVKDSKKLNKEQIQLLDKLVRNESVVTKTVRIGAKSFNDMFVKLKTEEKTLNEMLAWAHATALEDILKLLDRTEKRGLNILVVIDEFSRVKTDERLEMIKNRWKIDVIQTPKAEDLSTAVAAASIMAKADRDRRMIEFEERIGIPLRRVNLPEIRNNPLVTDVVKFVYIKDAENVVSVGNTIEGEEADAIVKEAIKNIEDSDIEFKSKFPSNAKKIAEVISAMANCDGGELYFGILQKGENKTVVGIDNPTEIEERVGGTLRACEPYPSIELTRLILSDGKSILKYKISMSPSLVYHGGGCLRRTGSGTQAMKKTEIENWPVSCRRSI